MSRKSIARQIAEHFGCDIADIRDYNYQPGHWSRDVFAGFDGNRYWSAGGSTPPQHRDGSTDTVWKQVVSYYPSNPHLWVGEAATDTDQAE